MKEAADVLQSGCRLQLPDLQAFALLGSSTWRTRVLEATIVLSRGKINDRVQELPMSH